MNPHLLILPLELEREIFCDDGRITPQDNSYSPPGGASRSPPLLYRVIVTNSIPPDVLRRAMHVEPPSFFDASVRHLVLIPCESLMEEAHALLLRLCTKTFSLAIIGTCSTPELLPMLRDMSEVRKWAGQLKNLFGSYDAIDLRHPFFRTITHMDVFDDGLNLRTYILPGLLAFPALTHLCLNETVPADLLRCVLEQSTRLQVLVQLWPQSQAQFAHQIATSPPAVDVRFVVGTYTRYWDPWAIGVPAGNRLLDRSGWVHCAEAPRRD
ncbi:hypothetical protein DFH07DRAFT_548079 [Mycena maculata]|uniref:Uncharacterized protein n=1 Tax=Mycena maculata TaxID=230809 RepID=A0AAD7ITV7_9AGAR|nr:hypothetical protein DFH07DRAFT_548079 [Mycena maculata]